MGVHSINKDLGKSLRHFIGLLPSAEQRRAGAMPVAETCEYSSDS